MKRGWELFLFILAGAVVFSIYWRSCISKNQINAINANFLQSNAASSANEVSLRGKLSVTEHDRDQLRQILAGRSTTNSMAALMGLHDETNYVTNIVSITNQVNAILVTNYASVITLPYILDWFQMDRIKTELSAIPAFPVSVINEATNLITFHLTRQIAQVFKASGFEPVFGGGEFPTNLGPGITIGAQSVPGDPKFSALKSIFDSMHQDAHWLVEPFMKSNEVQVYVR